MISLDQYPMVKGVEHVIRFQLEETFPRIESCKLVEGTLLVTEEIHQQYQQFQQELRCRAHKILEGSIPLEEYDQECVERDEDGYYTNKIMFQLVQEEVFQRYCQFQKKLKNARFHQLQEQYRIHY